MTKLSETIHYDHQDDKIVVQEKHNFSAVAEKAKALQSAGAGRPRKG